MHNVSENSIKRTNLEEYKYETFDYLDRWSLSEFSSKDIFTKRRFSRTRMRNELKNINHATFFITEKVGFVSGSDFEAFEIGLNFFGGVLKLIKVSLPGN